jgi:hypothetical protein
LFPEDFVEGISIRWIDLSVLLPSLIVFLGARFFRPLKLKSIFNVVIWVAAGILTAVFPTLLVFILSGSVSEYLAEQIPVGVISVPLLLGLCAITYSAWRISRSRLKQIRDDKAALTRARDELELQLAIVRDEIREGVQLELVRAKDALAAVSNPKKLADVLFKVLDDVIRPLSHRLSELEPSTTRPEPAQGESSVLNPYGKVSLSQLAAPDIFATLCAVFILPASFVFQGAAGLAAAIGLFVAEVGVLWVIERRTQGLLVNRMLGILGLAAISVFFGLGYSLVMGETGVSPIAVGFVTTSISTSGLMALISKRLDDVHRLALVNFELQGLVTLLRQEAWITKRQLATVIHGSVQTKFLTVALRLSKAEISLEDLNAAKSDIESALQDISNGSTFSTETFNTQVQRLEDSWDGVCTLIVSASAETIYVIDSTPMARTCLIEVLGEAIANAAKHSKSQTIDISITLEGQNQIELAIRSKGKLTDINFSQGFGSQLLNELTSHWSRENVGEFVLLRAQIPTANPV